MKILAVILWVCVVLFAVNGIYCAIVAEFDYQRTIESYWTLSDRASLIDQKSAYLDKFVAALESSNLAPTNATLFPTPAESTQQNLAALKSLQTRLHEIQTMDVRSLEYQQAIAQITAQEQGQAKEMLAQLEGSWYLSNHYFLWDWHGVLMVILWLVLAVVAIFATVLAADE